jgi:hypothetical protein
MTVSPTFGVAGLTPISMNGAAADVDGDALTYTWSFGSQTASGSSTSATLMGDGPVVVQLTVSDGHGGTAADSRTVTIGTMTGSWDFVAGPCGEEQGEPAVLTLTQTGGVITGSETFPSSWCNVAAGTHAEIPAKSTGTIDAQGNVSFPRIAVGDFLDIRLEKGKMDSTGRKVTGSTYNSGFDADPFTMTKR